MKQLLFAFSLYLASSLVYCQNITTFEVEKYKIICREKIYQDYKGMFKEPKGAFKYPYITPGSKTYSTQLWDWDSWFTGIALEQIVAETGVEKNKSEVHKYQQGCVLNFLNYQRW